MFAWPWTIRSCSDVTTLQIPMHNSILYLLFKRLVREKLSHVWHVGLVTFLLAFGGWIVEWFGLCITHPSLFRTLSRSFKNFAQRETKFLRWFPRSLRWYLLSHQSFWKSLNFLLSGLYVEFLVGWESLVPHDVVEPKIGSKKKLVMQLDRDVQVCGIFCLSF
jgi:hypothetical protein